MRLTIDGGGSKLARIFFLIAICRKSGDKWQSKTMFFAIFDLLASIVLAISIVAYPVCVCLDENILVGIPLICTISIFSLVY